MFCTGKYYTYADTYSEPETKNGVRTPSTKTIFFSLLFDPRSITPKHLIHSHESISKMEPIIEARSLEIGPRVDETLASTCLTCYWNKMNQL